MAFSGLFIVYDIVDFINNPTCEKVIRIAMDASATAMAGSIASGYGAPAGVFFGAVYFVLSNELSD